MNTSDLAKRLGKRGGKKTLEKYGKDHFRKIIQSRWDRVRAEKEALENESKTSS